MGLHAEYYKQDRCRVKRGALTLCMRVVMHVKAVRVWVVLGRFWLGKQGA